MAVPFRPRSALCESFAEERASAWTHGAGFVLAAAASVLMVAAAAGDGGLRMAAAAVFGATLLMLYLVSTLYHAVSTPRAKAFFQVLDHASIFLLIAGSYTPVALVALGGALGWSVFAAVWGMAALGAALKLRAGLARRRLDTGLSTTLYLAMGWMAAPIIGYVIAAVPPGGVWLLVAGGLCYTCGVGFFVWRRMPFSHAVWHVFVLAGSLCHAAAALFFIL